MLGAFEVGDFEGYAKPIVGFHIENVLTVPTYVKM